MLKWIDELVYVRGLAILAVVIIHVTMYAVILQVQSPMYFFGYFLDDFAHFAVPVFIIVSGVSLAFAYRTGLPLLSFYAKRVISVIPTFLFFTLVYGWLFSSEVSWLRRFVFGEGTIHLYFIPLLIKLYILFPIFLWIAKKITRLEIALIPLMAAQIIFSLRLQLINYVQPHFLTLYPTWNTVANDPFWLYVALFGIGVVAGTHIERLYASLQDTTNIKAYVLFAPLIPLFATIDYFLHIFNPLLISIVKDFYNIFACIVLFKLASLMIHKAGRLSRIIKEIGEHSFAIYLLHMIFINYLVDALQYGFVKTTNVVFYIALFVFSIYGSYTISYIVNLAPLPGFAKRTLTGSVVRTDANTIQPAPQPVIQPQAPTRPATATE